MNVNFTKDDLDTGMLVVTREDEKYLILKLKGKLALLNTNQRSYYDDAGCPSLHDDLTHNNKSMDIMKVYGLRNGDTALESLLYVNYRHELLWERIESKKMKLSQIEDILGYPVEIIDESENTNE